MQTIFTLTPSEVSEIEALITDIHSRHQNFDDPVFLKECALFAKRLPERLLVYLNEFRYNPPSEGYCIVSGFPIDDARLGPTPSHWRIDNPNATCWRECMLACLYSAALGDIFGWSTQQDGRIIHDVLPVKEYEHEQLGFSSSEELTWHTEDAFHELRGDYLAFFCLRNPDAVATTISRPDFSRLTPEQIDVLFERHYTIRPDNSHLPKNESEDRAREREAGGETLVTAAYEDIERRLSEPEKIAVLFGDKRDPYMSLDPYFMDEPEHPAAREALKALIDAVEAGLKDMALSPGECALIDNYMVVHGRRSFKARFDGTDRWHKRINITRDIRKSRHARPDAGSRLIY